MESGVGFFKVVGAFDKNGVYAKREVGWDATLE